MTGPELATASAVVLAGAAVQGAVGFGFALVAAPILLLVDVRLVPGPLIFASLLLTALTALREHRAIDLDGVGWSLVGRLPGTVLGAAVVNAVAPDEMALPVAAIVLVGVALTATRLHLRPTARTLLGAGVLSGFMGTASSIGGPPIALVYQRAPGPRLRATLGGYFAIGSVISLAALWWIGRFGRDEVGMGLALLPGVVVGFAASGRIARFLDGGYTRASVLFVSAAAGAIAIVRQLF